MFLYVHVQVICLRHHCVTITIAIDFNFKLTTVVIDNMNSYVHLGSITIKSYIATYIATYVAMYVATSVHMWLGISKCDCLSKNPHCSHQN